MEAPAGERGLAEDAKEDDRKGNGARAYHECGHLGDTLLHTRIIVYGRS